MEINEAIRIIQERYKSVMLRLPVIVGNEAVNFVLDNFRMQGFQGSTFERWANRKRGWNKDNRSNRNILIDKGRLRRSWRVTKTGPDYVSIGSDVPYAQAHNEGLKIGQIQTVKPFTRSVNYRDETSAPGASKSKFTSMKIGEVSVKGHTRRINQNIPRRRMIGNSPYLNARLKRVASAQFLKEIRYIKP
jgi:phage gpG-like protein